jgi:hypothetical protein
MVDFALRMSAPLRCSKKNQTQLLFTQINQFDNILVVTIINQ